MNNDEIYFMPTSYIEKKLRESGESELITAAADRLAMLDRETVRLEHELGAASHAYNELKQTCVDHEESYDELKDLFNKACAERAALREELQHWDRLETWTLIDAPYTGRVWHLNNRMCKYLCGYNADDCEVGTQVTIRAKITHV